MRAGDRLVDEVIDAILDGTPIDWTAIDAHVQATSFISELKVLAAVGEHRRDGSPPPATPAAIIPVLPEPPVDRVPAQWGHLRVIERIGRGSFGDVYRAWDTRLDREVALKLLPVDRAAGEPAASTLIDEGKLLARVRHPNVVTIYGAERISGYVGLWMELVRGHTLEQTLRDGSVLSATETTDVGIELCRAISAVHGVGVLHRDIKTHNVIRADDGRVLLMDFGTGRELGGDASSDLAGTPLYLAPEVLEGRPASVRSDIYSLGVLLYRLLTGAYPVAGRSVRDVRRAHGRGERIALRTARPGVPRRLARIVECAVDPNPERRFQSASDLGAALVRFRSRARVARRAYAAAALVAALSLGGLSWQADRGPSIAWLGSLWGSSALGAFGPIVVLPAQSGGDADVEPLADAVVDEVIRSLAFHGLEVRSRASSFEVRGMRDRRRIAKQLGAALVVEFSAQRRGDRVQVAARLFAAESDRPQWEDDYTAADSIFAIQDWISRGLVGHLGLTYRESRRRPVTNLDAYELQFRAQPLVEQRGFINGKEAAELFERALDLDPKFAAAHAGLAVAYAFRSFPFRGISFADAYPIMQRAARLAVELEPNLAEAHVAMGWVHAYEHDWVNADSAFRRAMSLNPSLTLAYTNYSLAVLQPLQKYDKALDLLRVAARHDPLSLDVQREIGEVQLFSGRPAAAADTLQRVSEPEFPFVPAYRARALTLLEQLDEAFRLLDPGHPYLASVYVKSGRRSDAVRLRSAWAQNPYALAVIAAALGDTEASIEAVGQVAAVEPHRLGRLLIEPELAMVRDDPRVRDLRTRSGLP